MDSKLPCIVVLAILLVGVIAMSLIRDGFVLGGPSAAAGLASRNASMSSTVMKINPDSFSLDNSTLSTTLPQALETSRPAGSDSCLVFFHIPKTAGTALGSVLAPLYKCLGWRNREWYTYRSRYGSRPPRMNYLGLFNQSMVHSGHLTRSFLDVTGTERCKIMTLLRDPVNRAISAFYYHSHKTEEWDTCLFANDKKRCRLNWQYNNDMVRILAGQGPTWNAFDEVKYQQVPVNETSVQLAKMFLLDMDLVCFQHDLEMCRRQLIVMLGINRTLSRTKDPIDRANVNTRRPNVTDITYNKVYSVNRFDVELYNWALQQDFQARGTN